MDTVKELREFIFDKEKAPDEKINILYSLFRDKYIRLRSDYELDKNFNISLTIKQKTLLINAICDIFTSKENKVFETTKNILSLLCDYNCDYKRKITDEESVWVFLILNTYFTYAND